MTTNLTTLEATLNGSARRETLNGRQYFVVPASMIVADRVLNGSQGKLFYPSDEVQRNPGVWNGVPITVGHPTVNGRDESARSPQIAEQFQIGVVYNDRFENGKRTADAWLDVALTRKKSPAIYAAVMNGKPVELSTGLYTDNEPVANGTAPDGTAYTHVARNYRPDHLAILPHQRGACSLKDGCGLMVGNSCEGVTNCGGEGGTPGPCKGGGEGYVSPQEKQNQEIVKKLNAPAAKKKLTPAQQKNKDIGDMQSKLSKMSVESKHSFAKEHGVNPSDYQNDYNLHMAIIRNPSAKAKLLSNNQEPTMNREQMIDRLVTNCECWKNKKDVLANEDAFADEDLLALNADLDAKTRNALVANSLAEAGVDLDDVTDNAMPAFIKEKIAAKEEEEEKVKNKKVKNKKTRNEDEMAVEEEEDEEDESEEEPMPFNKKVKNRKIKNAAMTPEQFEATIAASPALAAVWNAAKDVERQQRDAAIQRLTANVKDAKQKQLLVNEFSDPAKYDLAKLSALTAMLPAPARRTPTTRPADAVTNRFAANPFQYVGPGSLNLANNAEPCDDVLDVFELTSK